MTTFDTTKTSLKDLLAEIERGELQLPDFQRGWIWDDDHIRELLVSVARSFPIGAVMLLKTGGDVRFQTRPVEGLEAAVPNNVQPKRLILDGQQRLTTLTQAISVDGPVRTRTAKGKRIRRHYYFDIDKILGSEPRDWDEAIVAVDENRELRTNFGRDVELDLSTTERECREFHFPCRRIMDNDPWMIALSEIAPVRLRDYTTFCAKVIQPFQEYHLPVIELTEQATKEAVCLVFEKVNTGGVTLTVFELVTASYAAEGYNLRDDWFGSETRKVESRRESLEEDALLKGVRATEFLQGVSLLHSHELRTADVNAGKTGKTVRPVSAKKADVLRLPLSAWKKWAAKLEDGFRNAAMFLRRECFHSRRELPYRTQLVPLAAVLARLDERWQEPVVYDKLARWYWCGVLGELYGGAVETRMANDFDDLLGWIEDDRAVPRTVADAHFQPTRLDTLRTRQSAAYKGVNVLVIREGARDWFWKADIKQMDVQDVALDIHHIFPRAWCGEKGIEPKRRDCILNKTPISYKANRMLGGDAPSAYLPKLRQKARVDAHALDELLASHALSPDLLRRDAFDEFLEDRRGKMSALIERAMGKPVVDAGSPAP